MKIRSHSESHIVELEDGSKWQVLPKATIFDLDGTLLDSVDLPAGTICERPISTSGCH
jgi:hypothetical protein